MTLYILDNVTNGVHGGGPADFAVFRPWEPPMSRTDGSPGYGEIRLPTKDWVARDRPITIQVLMPEPGGKVKL